MSARGKSALTADTAVPRISGFSLAELMIALVILGLGLLFIAAALPVGLEYTRQTVDLATSDAAGECALAQIETTLRTAGNRMYDPVVDTVGTPSRLDNIHRPRDYVAPAGTGYEYPLALKYEPFIKVWPLSVGNIRFGVPTTAGATREIADNVDDVGSAIRTYLIATGFAVPAGTGLSPLEAGFDQTVAVNWCSTANQVLPGLARIYPPVEPVTTFSAQAFFNGLNTDGLSMYAARFNIMTSQQLDREREKALDRRIAWTAFYRRVAYDEPGLDLAFIESPPAAATDDIPTDPLLYEIIVVVTRRPTVNHRFARQDLSVPTPFETPAAYDPTAPPADDAVFGTDRLAPSPWLVVFDSNQSNPLPIMETFGTNLYAAGTPDRVIYATATTGFTDPATLTFRCTSQLGALLPVGSVFIPALNDNYRRLPGVHNFATGIFPALVPRLSGFVPHMPNASPIYEVVERPDVNTVIVRNDGHYPWAGGTTTPNTMHWPVWIIPPAFVERDSTGQPIYDQASPIVKVIRRTVTLREIQR